MGKVHVLQILAGGNEYNGVSDFLRSAWRCRTSYRKRYFL